MPSISETVTVDAPPNEVWPLLRDPEVVAGCIPGAELAPDKGDGLWRGQINVKFGPTKASFKGEAKLDFNDTDQSCDIQGRGIDGRGASRARAQGRFKLTGEEKTDIAITGEFNVAGPLEGFASSGGVHVARALLAEFSKNIAHAVAVRRGEAEADPDAKNELSGSKLLWNSAKSAVGSAFTKKDDPSDV